MGCKIHKYDKYFSNISPTHNTPKGAIFPTLGTTGPSEFLENHQTNKIGMLIRWYFGSYLHENLSQNYHN